MQTPRADLERALDELRTASWTIDLVHTARANDAMRLARTAVEEKLDAFIVCGGDGTLNEAANGLLGSETALGVLPMGTGNVWAKEMGMPIGDLVLGARRLRDADVRAIDVGQVSGSGLSRTEEDAGDTENRNASRIFVLWTSVGLDAAVTHRVEPQREMKRRWGAWFFWTEGVREGWNYRGKHAQLTFGDKRLRQRVIVALVANAQLYAGITRMAPDAKVDDGLLDLVVLKGTGTWATAWHVARVLLRLHVHDPQTEIYRVSTLKIAAKKMPLQVDGEPIGTTPVEISVLPRALKVLVPKTANRNLFSNW